MWDLGCGQGEFTAALIDLGAEFVLASDIQKIDDFEERLAPRKNFLFGAGRLEESLSVLRCSGNRKAVDLVFMHQMTEHVYDLRAFFSDLSRLLEPGTEFFICHDNFYNPMGHHDHSFVNMDETWIVEGQGPKCWDAAEKCAVSAEFRKTAVAWSAKSDATRNPDNCLSCNYFRRSQPWAHLLYGAEFRRVFPEPVFRFELNCVTPQQLIWLLQENDFIITTEHRSWVVNSPSKELELNYGRHELTTFALTLRGYRA